MKTGLTKKQKRTSIYFTEADEFVEICTYNTDFKKRLTEFADSLTAEEEQQVDDWMDGDTITNRRNWT